MAKYSANFKPRTNLFKSLGLVALIAFTFYFIYNYLATGSFSLKPRASEIVTTDVNSCGSIKDNNPLTGCNTYNGCSWVVGPSTTKTENVPSSTTVPVTNYLQVDCTDNDCSSGRHGCSYTTTSKTVNQTQVQAVYECDDGSGVSQSKCIQLGGAWVKTGTKTVTVPVTTTTKSCNGSWENPVTTQQIITTYTTKVVQVPGVGSCTGTLKPLTVQTTPIPPVGGGGGGSSGGGVSSTPSTSSGTCSAGMTRCGIDRYGNENSMIEVCTSGNWTPKSSVGICGENKCEVSSGVAKCKTETTKVIGCKAGDTATVACTKPGYSKKGTCKSIAGIGIWRYSPCEKNSQRVKCETRIVSGGFQWRDPSSKNNKWSSIVKGEYCANVFYDKKACVKGGENGYLICNYVAGAEDVCSNVGSFNTIDNNCQTNSDLADQYEPGLYGAKSTNDYSPQFQNIKCLRDVDCTNLTGISHLVCEGSNFSSFGRCVSNDMDGFCGNVKSQTSCDFYEGDVGVFKVRCIWNGKKCVAVSYSRNNL